MARPLVLFAPGAGAPSTSGWMRAWAARLGAIGEVEPFDYAYAREGRKAPDRLPKLIAAHQAALAEARSRYEGLPVVLAGKSMGSRVGCHVSLVERDVRAVVCFGYPLVGASGAVRDEVLLAMTAPILFVQGTRDPMGPLDRLADVRGRMRAATALHVVEGGDHSLIVAPGALRAAGEAQEDVDQRILEAVRAFVAEHAA